MSVVMRVNGQGHPNVPRRPIEPEHQPPETPDAEQEPQRVRLDVRVVERVAIVRLSRAEILLEDTAREVAEGLGRLVEAGGHTRLVLNLNGVKYLPPCMIDVLLALQAALEPRGGHLRLCGLAPLLRDLIQVARPESELDICFGEPDALGILAL